MKVEGDTSMKSIIGNLRGVYNALSHMKWVSASGFCLSMAGVLGVAGFVLSLLKDGKLGSNREKTSKKLCLLPGLQNLGNNCFLNVILQALASCSYFQSFLQRTIDECESCLVLEQGESLPLTITLATLLEELCVVGKQRVVLSPHKVMVALALYIHNFNLTSQQDAEEAFLHLLSSLREEFVDFYPPSQCTLADVLASPDCRILSSRGENKSEQERWQQYFLGPFDGITCSILTCQSCSSQISLDFQLFHSLPLSPVLYSGSAIMAGCTLEDCLRQFVVAEQIENYFCGHCWHIAAVKYLSSNEAGQMDIDRLKRCSSQDSCDCRSLLHLEALPWSNNFSNTLKQLKIARCPKILCLHLQRVSINEFGEPVKHQGHITFPLILDLFPFMANGVEVKYCEGVKGRGQVKLQYQKPIPSHCNFNTQFDTILNHICEPMVESASSEVLAPCEFESSLSGENFVEKSNVSQSDGSSNSMHADPCEQLGDKMSSTCKLAPSESQLYRLVSVVEHFGRAGSGHYVVYRCIRTKFDEEDSDESVEPANHWFCISDSEVYSVLEKDVLAAEASLLFYERIMEG